ncbi:MAG TPA: hypothetical protein RMH99_00250 [Sandaracinaceae bacterium LLY-WYZ-13_1]|nr:hypothetical protein [Sandaracinaceae bacterium LLY-WYZ-13_1]
MRKLFWRLALFGSLIIASVTMSGCPLGRWGGSELGETCDDNVDCESRMCYRGVCSSSCRTDADCSAASAPMTCEGNVPSENNVEGYGHCVPR